MPLNDIKNHMNDIKYLINDIKYLINDITLSKKITTNLIVFCDTICDITLPSHSLFISITNTAPSSLLKLVL